MLWTALWGKKILDPLKTYGGQDGPHDQINSRYLIQDETTDIKFLIIPFFTVFIYVQKKEPHRYLTLALF